MSNFFFSAGHAPPVPNSSWPHATGTRCSGACVYNRYRHRRRRSRGTFRPRHVVIVKRRSFRRLYRARSRRRPRSRRRQTRVARLECRPTERFARGRSSRATDGFDAEKTDFSHTRTPCAYRWFWYVHGSGSYLPETCASGARTVERFSFNNRVLYRVIALTSARGVRVCAIRIFTGSTVFIRQFYI